MVAHFRGRDGLGQRTFHHETVRRKVGVVQPAGRDDCQQGAGRDALVTVGHIALARADLGPRKVHEDPQAMAGRPFGGANMIDHPLPRGGIVMRAVDPDRFDPALGQRKHERGIVGGLARAGDHQRNRALVRRMAEDRLGSLAQPLLAREHLFRRWALGVGMAPQRGETCAHRKQGGRNAAFEPAERGQAQRQQGFLQRPQVAMPHSQIMGKVARTLREVGAGKARQPVVQPLIPFAAHLVQQRVDLCVKRFDGVDSGYSRMAREHDVSQRCWRTDKSLA